MKVIANWWEVSATRKHTLVYVCLIVLALAGNAIRNCVAQAAPPSCRVNTERLPSIVRLQSDTLPEPGLEGLLMELREGRN